MTPYEIIKKKRDGERLTAGEIDFFISDFTKGRIPDYQMSAFLMAVYFQGMHTAECHALTRAMTASGEVADLSSIKGFTVDKHSTGGVGDTTTLVLAPLVAACGGFVPKMTGRELGHTGGTVDKLESIPGMQLELTLKKFIDTTRNVGFSLLAQTARMAPADKHIYALRNVTATVDAIPLIAASVMSKKLAAGADGIVLDVKTGAGAFTPRYEDALALAQTMVDIGRSAGKKMVAVVTGMAQPLGRAVGNAVEVREAIDTLDGRGPDDLVALVLELGSHMLQISGIASSRKKARRILEKKLATKKGLEKFKAFVHAQGGDPAVVENPGLLPQPRETIVIGSPGTGFVQEIDSLQIGMAAKILGAGRRTKEDAIDHSIGIILKKKVGDAVDHDDALAVLHTDGDPEKIGPAREKFLRGYTIGERPVAPPQLFYARIREDGVEVIRGED